VCFKMTRVKQKRKTSRNFTSLFEKVLGDDPSEGRDDPSSPGALPNAECSKPVWVPSLGLRVVTLALALWGARGSGWGTASLRWLV
jgi:hypothetical protein